MNARVSASRQNVTVIACANAAGLVMPPHFMVPRKIQRAKQGFREDEFPLGSEWDVQEKAGMSDAMGPKWFKNVFLKHCGPTDPNRPQVLILDKRHSHDVFDLLYLARENNVAIFALPARTTQWLQPLYHNSMAATPLPQLNGCNPFNTTQWLQPL